MSQQLEIIQGALDEPKIRENDESCMKLLGMVFPDEASGIMEMVNFSFQPVENNTYFLLKKGGKILGASFLYKFPNYYHLYNFAVSPGHRRQGLGRFLFTAITNYVQHDKIAWEVKPENKIGISFYTSMGADNPNIVSKQGNLIMTWNVGTIRKKNYATL